MTWNTRGLGTHGNNDNVMLRVLDTAKPRINFVSIISDRFFTDSNEGKRSCTIITDPIRIREGNYTYMSRVQCMLACVPVNWPHDTVARLKKIPIYVMQVHYARACIRERLFNKLHSVIRTRHTLTTASCWFCQNPLSVGLHLVNITLNPSKTAWINMTVFGVHGF